MTLTTILTFLSFRRITFFRVYVFAALLICVKIGWIWLPVHGSTLSKTLYLSKIKVTISRSVTLLNPSRGSCSLSSTLSLQASIQVSLPPSSELHNSFYIVFLVVLFRLAAEIWCWFAAAGYIDGSAGVEGGWNGPAVRHAWAICRSVHSKGVVRIPDQPTGLRVLPFLTSHYRRKV